MGPGSELIDLNLCRPLSQEYFTDPDNCPEGTTWVCQNQMGVFPDRKAALKNFATTLNADATVYNGSVATDLFPA